MYKQFQFLKNERVQQNETLSKWASGLKSSVDKSIIDIRRECEQFKQQQQQQQQVSMNNVVSKNEGDWDFQNSDNVMSYKK